MVYAWDGLIHTAVHQRNMRMHLIAAIMVGLVGSGIPLGLAEKVTMIFCVLLVLFAGIAVALAMIGIFGVLSYAVNQRMNELGIRIALGASPAKILGIVLFNRKDYGNSARMLDESVRKGDAAGDDLIILAGMNQEIWLMSLPAKGVPGSYRGDVEVSTGGANVYRQMSP